MARIGELDDIIDFRLAVECQAVRFAADRRTASDLTEISRAARRLEKAARPSEYRLADVAFHSGLAHASKSRRLSIAVEQARGDLFEPTDDLGKEGRELTVEQHCAVYDALRDKDGDAAAAAMVTHIESTRTEMKAFIQLLG